MNLVAEVLPCSVAQEVDESYGIVSYADQDQVNACQSLTTVKSNAEKFQVSTKLVSAFFEPGQYA